MTDYKALIEEARAHIEQIAMGVPESQADLVRRGENDDRRTSLIVHLADAEKETFAEKETLRSTFETPCSTWCKTHEWMTTRAPSAEAERDAALKALGESRARFGDMEQRALAAEATVEAIRTVVTEWAVPAFSERHYGAHAAITKIRNALTEETR